MSLRKKQNGDDFEFSAEAYNALVDANEFLKSQYGAFSSYKPGAARPGIIMVHNVSGASLSMFDVAVITAPVNDISSAEDAIDSTNHLPLFNITTTVVSVKQPVVVLQEDLASGAVGKALIYGVTPARIKVKNKQHYFAQPASGGLLVTAASGSVHIISELALDDDYSIVHLGGSGGGGDSGYTGPFAVTNTSDDETNELTIAEGFYRHGLNDVGVAKSTVYPDASGYAYIKITYEGSAYVFKSDFADSVPESLSGTIYVPIAYAQIDTDGNIASITQIQYGDLLTPGVL